MAQAQRTLLARLARARVPSSIARPAAMKIIAGIKAAIAGLVVVPANILATLLPEAPLADDLLEADDAGRARLTRRELEVLAAMATVPQTKRSPVG